MVEQPCAELAMNLLLLIETLFPINFDSLAQVLVEPVQGLPKLNVQPVIGLLEQ